MGIFGRWWSETRSRRGGKSGAGRRDERGGSWALEHAEQLVLALCLNGWLSCVIGNRAPLIGWGGACDWISDPGKLCSWQIRQRSRVPGSSLARAWELGFCQGSRLHRRRSRFNVVRQGNTKFDAYYQHWIHTSIILESRHRGKAWRTFQHFQRPSGRPLDGRGWWVWAYAPLTARPDLQTHILSCHK